MTTDHSHAAPNLIYYSVVVKLAQVITIGKLKYKFVVFNDLVKTHFTNVRAVQRVYDTNLDNILF